MVFGGELIARDTNRSNHRFGRQRSAFETVDADHRTGTRHVLELLLQDRRVVRERLDLLARQGRAKRRAVPVGGRLLFVLFHGDRRLDALDRQHGDLPVLAVPHADISQQPFFESGKLDLNGISARCERRDDCHTRVRRAHRRDRRGFRRFICRCDGDGRADDDRAGLIHDGNAQRSAGSGLGEEVRAGEIQRRSSDQNHEQLAQGRKDVVAHFGASNFRGSIFTLTLTRSNVVSSIVSPATARRMRNGHLMPFTVRYSA